VSDIVQTVSTAAELDQAIYNVDSLSQASPGGSYTIVVDGSIDLADPSTGLATAGLPNDSNLDAINLGAVSTLTIEGNGDTIDGGGAYAGFFAYQGTVAIANLTIADTLAKGGSGGYAAGGGGGLGGGLFVASGAQVTLSAVSFAGDSAVGGNGAGVPTQGNEQVGGGGGLLGGNGGSGSLGGGGGGGVGASGGVGHPYSVGPGAAGLAPGAAGAGSGATTIGQGGNGHRGGSGGGGGGGQGGGGGGIGGGGGSRSYGGGGGGFGGGGGSSIGGGGGFGGGGGAGENQRAGAGGFGGGGAGGFSDYSPNFSQNGGAGGFGAGAGGSSAQDPYADVITLGGGAGLALAATCSSSKAACWSCRAGR